MKKTFVSFVTVFLVLLLGVTSVSAFTPPGLAKKGGLPPGIQKKFIQLEKGNKEYNTKIKDLDLDKKRIVIEDGTAILSLLVSDKAKIELNRKSAKLEDIRKNDEVSIKLDKNNTIIELKATREKETVYIVEGKLLCVNKKQNEIYIYEDGKLATYTLGSRMSIVMNGRNTNIDNLAIGMELKLTIEGNKVKSIVASKDLQTKIKGTIIGIDPNRFELVIQEGTKTSLYKAKSTTPIKIDSKTKTFKDLLVGMELEAYVKDQSLVTVEAKSLAVQTEKGNIKYINVDKREISLVQGTKERLFTVSSDAVIKINGITKRLKDVGVNMEAELKVQKGEVIEININRSIQSFEGRIIGKDIGTKPTITIQIGNETKVFPVKADLNIIGVEVGKDGIIHVKDHEVIAIAVK